MTGSSAGRRTGGGGGEGGRREEGEREERKATEGPTRSSREPGQTEGTSLSCCFLPVLGQLSNQVTSLSRVASGQLFSSLSLFSLSLLLSLLSSQCHSLQLLRLMSFFDRILSVPACWFLPLCLNKCKHGEGSFRRGARRGSFTWDAPRGRRSDCNAALMQTRDDMQSQICSFKSILVSV